MAQTICPCDSGKAFADCCRPFLSGRLQPASPTQLMRSRYSAFCTGNIDYLIATQHPAQRTAADRQTLAQTIAETAWLALRVLHADESQVVTGRGQVEFVAYYKSHGTLGQLHERSNFVRQGNRWYYTQGVRLPPLRT
jgi:SEC-C motif domain protein